MRTSTKVILFAASVTALLGAPAMAKAAHHHRVMAPIVHVPYDGYASVAPYGTFEGGPYTPSTLPPRHGLNPDFQSGHPQ